MSRGKPSGVLIRPLREIPMRRYTVALIALAGLASLGQAADLRDPSPSEIEGIISKFAAKESEFAKARANYTYRQTAKIQEMDEGGNPGGRFEEVTEVTFTPEGRRQERVIRAPATTLRMVSMSKEDVEDMRSVQPFVLTSNEIDSYNVRYLGREVLDEIPSYVFAVRPKHMEQGKRYFAGVIWVDDRDLQIVKTYGRATGLLKRSEDQQFPKFETYREQVDGKYWFPTYTIANDLLHFKDGQDVRLKQTMRYEDYKQFKSSSTITFGDVVDDSGSQKKPAVKPDTPPKQ